MFGKDARLATADAEWAQQTGISYTHLIGVANANEAIPNTDVHDPADALEVPRSWLRCGWTPNVDEAW